MLKKNLFFIDTMQFTNSNSENLFKNRPEDKFKYLSQDIFGQQLEFVKQKGIYPYEYMNI